MTRTFLPAPEPAPGRPRLVVTGFMGTGKTEAGRHAARLLGLPFVDLDEVVEARAGAPVHDVFAAHGEEAFRRLERAAVLDAARLSGAVVATGGGAVLHPASFGRLAEGSVVAVLTSEPAELTRRLRRGRPRPLLEPDLDARVGALLEGRAAAYAAAGEPLDTTGLTPEEAGVALADRYRRRPAGAEALDPVDPAIVALEVAGPAGPYPVLLGPGAIEVTGRAIPRFLPDGGRAALVADGSVAATCGERVAGALTRAGIDVAVRVALPAGERAKSMDALAHLWERFARAGLDRSGVVVAVGGGAALDVAGFAAATYARGVALVNVPTTLLAMVDAALGGKGGIDHAGIKNLVGAFHHPRMVVADLSVLSSLPPRAVRSGLAEVVKAAAVASPLVLDVLGGLPLDTSGIPHHLGWLVEQSVRIKAGYVREDPRDLLLRHALNLGHTFAHAIESASGYAVPHGEAVAMGLVAASRLGAAAGVTDGTVADQLVRVLRRLGLPIDPPAGLAAEALRAAMAADKKARAGRAVFVVPASGGAELLEGVDLDDALAALLQGPPAAPDGVGGAEAVGPRAR